MNITFKLENKEKLTFLGLEGLLLSSLELSPLEIYSLLLKVPVFSREDFLDALLLSTAFFDLEGFFSLVDLRLIAYNN